MVVWILIVRVSATLVMGNSPLRSLVNISQVGVSGKEFLTGFTLVFSQAFTLALSPRVGLNLLWKRVVCSFGALTASDLHLGRADKRSLPICRSD